MRICWWEFIIVQTAAARAALVAGLVAAGLAIALPAPAGAASGCTSSGGIPCSPITTDDRAEVAEHGIRGRSFQGRTVPDEQPPQAEADTAKDEAFSAAAGSLLNAPEANSTFRFYNRNSSGKQINFRFFSKKRNWVWPGGNKYWYIPPDRKQYYVTLSCVRGEKVCFGGYWPSQPNVYWGVGRNGDKACAACCYKCNGGQAAVNFIR
jgi:hypothetical protein